MAVIPQPLKVGFSGGIDSKRDPKTVPTTQLLDLQNATFIKQTTLSKRNGYHALGKQIDTQFATYTNATGLAKRDDEVVLFANANSYSYRPSSDSWAPIQAVSSVVVSDVPVARTGTHQTQPDMAVNLGVEVVAWEDSRGGVWCSVVEQVSQRIILAATQLDASGQRPRCCAVGNVLHVYWANGVRIWCAIVNPSNPEAVPTPLILTEDVLGGYDAVSTFTKTAYTSQPVLIAWGAVGGYRIGYVHPSGALGGVTNGLPAVATIIPTTTGVGVIGCALWSAATPIACVVYGGSTGTGTGYRFHDATNFSDLGRANGGLTSTFAPPVRITVEFHPTNAIGDAWYAVENAGSTADTNFVQSGQLRQAGINTPNTVVHGHCLASRAFADGSDVFVALVHSVLFFPYVAICQMTQAMRMQARVMPGSSTGALPRGHLPSVVPISTRQHAIALSNRIQLTGTSGTQFGETGIRANTFDFAHPQNFQTAQLGRGLYLASAVPQSYDGVRWAEADFSCAPDTATGGIAAPVQAVAGSALTVGGTYLWRFIYEEIDGQGEIHPGPTSAPLKVLLTATNDKVTITIPTYRLTNKRRVRIGVFRTLANATGTIDQIPFFRVSSVDPTVGGSNGYVLNDSTVDTVTFVDQMPDATAALLEPLYTNGGTLSNDPVPMGGGAIAGGKSRLFWTDPSNPNLVRYSQQLRDDTAMETGSNLSLQVDPYGGPIVAIGVMDDAVYAFKTTSVYGFAGPGPDADGGKTSTNAFSPAQLVTSDVGCTDPNSVCQSPMGIVFKSAKGFKLLGRDQQVQDIGAPVYGYNGQTVTRATLLPDRHQVVFLTSSGRTLLWDYEFNQWSTYTNHEGLDALVSRGVYHYLRTDGRVFKETPGVFVDDTTHIPMVIETAWIRAVDYLQGWQRILWASFLGTYISAHSLRVRFRIDYEDGYSAPMDLDVDTNYNPDLYGAGSYGAGAYGGAGGATTVYQRQMHINRRCEAISFRIEDVEQTANYGGCFQLTELLLTGGVLGPKMRVGASRSS